LLCYFVHLALHAAAVDDAGDIVVGALILVNIDSETAFCVFPLGHPVFEFHIGRYTQTYRVLYFNSLSDEL